MRSIHEPRPFMRTVTSCGTGGVGLLGRESWECWTDRGRYWWRVRGEGGSEMIQAPKRGCSEAACSFCVYMCGVGVGCAELNGTGGC